MSLHSCGYVYVCVCANVYTRGKLIMRGAKEIRREHRHRKIKVSRGMPKILRYRRATLIAS